MTSTLLKDKNMKTSFGRSFGAVLGVLCVLTAGVGLGSYVAALAGNTVADLGSATNLITLGLAQGFVAGATYTVSKAVEK